MEELILFCLTFLLIYLIYFIFVIKRKNALENISKTTEVMYLKKRYKLKKIKLSNKKLANIIALSNSFIISFTVFIVSIISNLILKILIAMIIMIPFILIVYHFIGLYLKKKEND